MDREEVGRKVVETSQACSDGYRRNISQFNTESENCAADACAIAASNTGWFILDALGFSNEEKSALVEAYLQKVHSEEPRAMQ